MIGLMTQEEVRLNDLQSAHARDIVIMAADRLIQNIREFGFITDAVFMDDLDRALSRCEGTRTYMVDKLAKEKEIARLEAECDAPIVLAG